MRSEPRLKRKRILMLLSSTFVDGGIQRFNRTLLAACGRLPVACDVLSLADRPDSSGRWPVPANVTVRVFGGDKIRYALSALRAIALGRYDVVLIGHVHLVQLGIAAVRLVPWHRPRTVLIGHGIELWTGVAGSRRRAMAATQRILCVSNYTKQMVQGQAPELRDDRFGIFPNALDESWLSPREGAVGAAPTRALPRRFILSVSRLDRPDRPKGIGLVIQALAMLEDADLHYVIAGRGDDMEFLQQAARRLEVSERVHFLGAVSDQELVELYRRCEAFVLPSAKEGFGIVFIEAMYFGAPVIAAREKGAVDVVKDGETGLLVEYDNVRALKDAIGRLLTDVELRERLRAAARATVTGRGRFTFAAFVDRCAAALGVTAS
jgi:phosphatidyl-myo-inositol dimannoside synthase